MLPLLGYATLHFENAQKGWLANHQTIFTINNNIVTDSVTIPLTGGNSFISSIQSISPTIVYAAGTGGDIFKSTDGGASFARISTLLSLEAFTDIHFLSEQLGYASQDSRIYKTSNGGQSWQPVVTSCGSIFFEVHFTDANHGWAITESGKIFRFVQ